MIRIRRQLHEVIGLILLSSALPTVWSAYGEDSIRQRRGVIYLGASELQGLVVASRMGVCRVDRRERIMSIGDIGRNVFDR